MYFLVECDSKEVIARFSSKTHGLTIGRLMAKHKARALELRKMQGGVPVATFTPAGETTRLDN
jgi:hypothetical protein